MKYFILIFIEHFIYAYIRSCCNLQCTDNDNLNHIKAHPISLVFWIFKMRTRIWNMVSSSSQHIQDCSVIESIFKFHWEPLSWFFWSWYCLILVLIQLSMHCRTEDAFSKKLIMLNVEGLNNKMDSLCVLSVCQLQYWRKMNKPRFWVKYFSGLIAIIISHEISIKAFSFWYQQL